MGQNIMSWVSKVRFSQRLSRVSSSKAGIRKLVSSRIMGLALPVLSEVSDVFLYICVFPSTVIKLYRSDGIVDY